jgi:hypothetical protein
MSDDISAVEKSIQEILIDLMDEKVMSAGIQDSSKRGLEATMDIGRSTILNVMKLPHFGRHQEVNACVKLLLSCLNCGYLLLDRRITVDLKLIHRITRLSMQGPNPQEFYPGKVVDCTLAQTIKDTYSDVEKGKRCYKVASIQNDAVCLA